MKWLRAPSLLLLSVVFVISTDCCRNDATPPTISDVQSTKITKTSAIVSWTTDEPATSQVEYGLNSAYGSIIASDAALVISHTLKITGLEPNTVYHYRVDSKDAANNDVLSNDYVFTTAQEAITVMTYNVLNGSGVGPTDPNGQWCCEGRGCCGAKGGNRLPLILEIIKAVSPDIVGIQEAYLWQQDDDAIARQVAQELGMNYYIGTAGIPDGAHVVLFTKFQIVEATIYPEHFTSPVIRGGLHAVLKTDLGNTLHIFLVHLRPDSTSENETSFLLQIANPFLNDLTIIMGDMNFLENSSQASNLHEAGWQLAVTSRVDHIWVSHELACYVESGPSLSQFNLAAASDHNPVVAQICIPVLVR